MQKISELKAFYFPHDIYACTDPKLVDIRVRFGWKAIGMYWAIIEALHKEGNGEIPDYMIESMLIDYYDQEEMRTHQTISSESKELCAQLYANALLVSCDGKTTTLRVQKNLADRKMKSDKARQSALIKHHGRDNITNEAILRTQCEGNANALLRKKRKEKIIIQVFTPPNLEEVEAYCQERKNGFNAQEYFDRNTATGWIQNGSKIKNWKAHIRWCESRMKKFPTKTGQAKWDL